MSLEKELVRLVKQIHDEKRLGDKRAEQFYNLISTLSQADIAGLTTADSPVFVTPNISNIQFPAVQVVSANANNLDDYEEGTWTIGLTFGGGSVGMTFSNNTGLYTKIGNRVFVNGYLALTAKGTSTGAAIITGLPFTSKNDAAAFSAVTFRLNGVTFANAFEGYVNLNATTITLNEITEAGAVTALTNANFSNTSSMIVSVSYQVA